MIAIFHTYLLTAWGKILLGTSQQMLCLIESIWGLRCRRDINYFLQLAYIKNKLILKLKNTNYKLILTSHISFLYHPLTMETKTIIQSIIISKKKSCHCEDHINRLIDSLIYQLVFFLNPLLYAWVVGNSVMVVSVSLGGCILVMIRSFSAQAYSDSSMSL